MMGLLENIFFVETSHHTYIIMMDYGVERVKYKKVRSIW